jgi:hypothetical protein
MAKPTKHAPAICTVMTILALIGIVIGLIAKSPLIIIILLVPTVIYEVYRTEGRSTKSSSILLLLVLVVEIGLLIFKVDFNLAQYLGVDEKYIGGYLVPLGDIRILGPTIMAVLSVVLIVRTYGIYTKWLAAIIFITSFAIIYSIDPAVFQDLLKYGVEEGLDRVR